MKKVLEKEMHRANNTSKASEPAFTNEEMKEMNEWMKEEKSLIDQASDAIQSVEKGLKDGSFPVYLQPFVKKALVKMKSIRDRALKNLKDMKTSESVEGKKGIKGVQQVERAEGVKGSEGIEGVKMKSGAETGKRPSDQSNSESMHSSDFMKSLKQGKANHSDILVQSFVHSHA